jgi:hypothetical protein
MSDDYKNSDIRILTLGLDREEETFAGYITFQFYSDGFSVYEGLTLNESKWSYENLNIETAKRLRDFLNYALKDHANSSST